MHLPEVNRNFSEIDLKSTFQLKLLCGDLVVSKLTFACQIEFSSTTAKLYMIFRYWKYMVA